VNTLATVRIATAEPARVTVNGARTATAAGVLKTGVTAGTIELVMGSGSYRVVAAAPQTTILNSQEEEKQEKP